MRTNTGSAPGKQTRRVADLHLRGVVAAIDHQTSALPVLVAARGLAGLLDLPVSAIHVEESATSRRAVEELATHSDVVVRTVTGDPRSILASVAANPDVAVLVVGTRGLASARSSMGHVASHLVRAATSTPILLVPPTERLSDEPIHRVLEPLDTDADCAAATEPIIERLRTAGCDVIGLHVFEASTIPSFLDHAGYGADSWKEEFARRHGLPDVEVRRGAPGRRIVEMARDRQVDLVVLGWSRVMDNDHGQVVAQVLAGTEVPVMLIPTGTRPVREDRA
jgi:nucleotide-binding universal stress UspA family protein